MEKEPSGAHTFKSGRNEARLVVTYRIAFSDEAIRKAPYHINDGMSLLRKRIEDTGGEALWNEAFTQDAEEIFHDSDDVTVTSVKVEVCS